MKPEGRKGSSRGAALLFVSVLACAGTDTRRESPDADAPSGADAGPAYANVTAVSVDSGSEGAYSLAVSIESSDIDCSQYANWWEVLSPEGTLVYRRILEHSHTDENGTTDPDAPGNTFTRTGGPVGVVASDMLIVRAHMSNAGYVGVAMRGSVAAGFTSAPDIAADFASAVESAAPQPTGCSF